MRFASRLLVTMQLAVLLVLPALANGSVPYYDIEQNGVPVNTLNIPVGSTFTVDVWIRNTPSIGLEGFLLIVFWDSTMMELTSHQNAGNTNSWGTWWAAVYTSPDHIAFQGGDSGATISRVT
jgi:hypothetical protein